MNFQRTFPSCGHLQRTRSIFFLGHQPLQTTTTLSTISPIVANLVVDITLPLSTPPISLLISPACPAREKAPTAKMSLSNCRFYEEKYPEIDSFVMVNVKQVRYTGVPVVRMRM